MVRHCEFDIVIWGATGFVGRRVAHQLASRCDGGLRWAIGGRNRARLEAVRSELGPAAQDTPILTGDSHDVASLQALAARTNVVCSTVGPFAIYGSELVDACVRSGTHYCDLSGEPHWMRKMIDAHQAEAERTGARIVHACGMDSIPSDIGVFFLQRAARERHGKPCAHISMRVKAMKAGFSGGTAASFVHAMEEGKRDPSIGRFMTEPYCLNPEGRRRGPDPPDRMMPLEVAYDADLKAWTMPFFMGPMNSKIVRRSNALLGYPYGEDFRYEEAVLVGGGPAGWLRAAMGVAGARGFMLAMALPSTRWLLKRYVLPKSGEGPGRELRESGFWELILIGKLGDGNVMRARIEGAGDPGVESTSRMLVESALCLAEDSDRIAVGGGFWTPASAMGEVLLPRLTSDAGLRFELDQATNDDLDGEITFEGK
jgi:short subunit dehydrogenase-like uncharacterized protein